MKLFLGYYFSYVQMMFFLLVAGQIKRGEYYVIALQMLFFSV